MLICGGGKTWNGCYPAHNYPSATNSGSKVGLRATFGGVLMQCSVHRLYFFEKKFSKQKPTPSFSKNYKGAKVFQIQYLNLRLTAFLLKLTRLFRVPMLLLPLPPGFLT